MALICIDWLGRRFPGSIRGRPSSPGMNIDFSPRSQSFAFLRQTVRASSFQKRDTFVSWIFYGASRVHRGHRPFRRTSDAALACQGICAAQCNYPGYYYLSLTWLSHRAIFTCTILFYYYLLCHLKRIEITILWTEKFSHWPMSWCSCRSIIYSLMYYTRAKLHTFVYGLIG